MAAIEIIHHMKTKTRGKQGEVALKLDIKGLSSLIRKAEDENEALVMKNILSTYEFASGQSINLQKSEVYFSKNVSAPIKNSIASLLGVQQVMGTGKYLGLPSMVGRSRKATFKFIKDRIWKKINSWSSRCLSQAGREVMIKSVLQSIPSYIMSIFLLPHSLSEDIEKMLNSFWWGHNQEHSKGIHWLSWERLTMHKNAGGLGFKSITAFNYAMFGKQAWNLLTNPGSLITIIFKAKYYSQSDFLNSSIGHNPSYVWRSIWSAKFIVRNGYQWVIGSGHDIPIWNYRWTSDGSIFPTPPNLHEDLANMTISDILIGNEKRWNAALIQDLVDDNTATKILKTPLLESVQNDRIIWRYEKNGIYSVKSAYRYCIVDAIDTSHLQVLGTVERSLFAALLWSIWQQRNNKVWQNRNETIHVVCDRARNLLMEWNVAQEQQHQQQRRTVPQQHAVSVWSKPPLGRYKCNVDASFSIRRNRTEIGICIRDDQGSFVLAKTEWLSPILDVDTGEAVVS
ncbi:hypothetical protein TSUD_71290 [Trifolium subterraneum]|uniref:Reverse transcriptase zinc-binding domain-containing protein n=1 Tax=Trifolium subterraneum TaxID=3900 RepID=A0A2Z6MPC6_TRISU|nr:hypothetical protein TSUD_71290 [Trifolium subterraneum]